MQYEKTIREKKKEKVYATNAHTSMAYVIVGLGNPTVEYENTRHNIGRIIVEAIAEKSGTGEWKHDKKLNAQRAKGEIAGEKVEFVLPDTYMNRSGGAVALLVKSAKAAEKLVVIHDEIDLPLASMKVVFNRGSGGHRGVESIIKAIKTPGFVRIRIGVAPTTPSGKPKKPVGEDAVVDFLMGNLNKKEVEALKDMKQRAYDAVVTIIEEGREKAMNVFNQK